MSNTAFNFLSNSFLTTNNKEYFLKQPLPDIEKELDSYRTYLNSNRSGMDKECISDNEDSVEISDFRILQKLPDHDEIFQKSLFLNRFVIDDPLYSKSYKNFDLINLEREYRGYQRISELQAKEQLWDTVQYMKGLLPGVNANVGYIKFYPLSKEPTNELLHFVNIPDLSFPQEFPEIYEWFLKNIKVRTVDDNQKVVDLVEPCKKLAISFENDGSDLFLPALLTDGIPSVSLYQTWKEEEIIKSIRDRYLILLRKNEFRIKFGAIVSADTEFEFAFLNSIIKSPTNTTDAKALQVLTKLKLPSLASTSFDKVMEVRKFFDETFENFRKQLKDDVLHLQQINDEKHIEEFSKELERKYEASIKEIEAKMKFKFKLSGSDIFTTSLDIATMLTTTEYYPLMITGANALYKVYEGLAKPKKEAQNNLCYFLHKLK
ncbi:hypothetical protein [Flavobacterium sp. HJSW_4]|uniref:hypothetical protein n=1 Tax=Flavobacterium sp. HJSW_4 TaxID=3344660 RepID=UPI0035F4A0E2